MRPTLSFWAPGRPRPEGSFDPVGPRVRHASRGLAEWRDTVATMAMGARRGQWPTADGPVSVTLAFALPHEKSYGWPAWTPIGHPDVDKLARAVLDAIVTAQLIRDDRLVVHLEATKSWAAARGPGVEVAIMRLVQPTPLPVPGQEVRTA